MANDYFQFQRFRVSQQRCAMKVGTDATLLGAWATGGNRMLDIGTGTGIVALMMAQRYPDGYVTAIDIDAGAASQAEANVAASPFRDRVVVVCGDVKTYAGSYQSLFDSIVCNPPYFVDSLTCPDPQRTVARHATALTYADLMASACRLLTGEGTLSVIIPADSKSRLESEAALTGLSLTRECGVKTTPRKAPRRYLLAFARRFTGRIERSVEVLEESPGVRSSWYDGLTRDFYIR